MNGQWGLMGIIFKEQNVVWRVELTQAQGFENSPKVECRTFGVLGGVVPSDQLFAKIRQGSQITLQGIHFSVKHFYGDLWMDYKSPFGELWKKINPDKSQFPIHLSYPVINV